MMPAFPDSGSASLRVLSVLAAGFGTVLVGTLALAAPQVGGGLLAALAALHLLVFGGVVAALWWCRRWLLETLDELVAQVDSAGTAVFVERVQHGADEWQPIARALNLMVVRLAAQIDERDRRLGAMQREAGADEVTGLATRAAFMARLQQLLQRDPTTPACAVVAVRVDDLPGLNQRLGHERADALLVALATLLRTRAVRLSRDGGLAARLNGSEFALLLPDIDFEALPGWTQDLANALDSLRLQGLSDRPRTGWIASGEFRGGEIAADVLKRLDQALHVAAVSDTPWRSVPPPRVRPTLSIAQWRLAIDDALDAGRVTLALQDVVGSDPLLRHRQAHVLLTDASGHRHEGDELMAAAAATGRRSELDLRAAELALTALRSDDRPVALSLSARSAERPAFVSRLGVLLADAAELAERLWLEIDPAEDPDLPGLLAPLTVLARRSGLVLGLREVRAPIMLAMPLARLRVRHLRLDETLGQMLEGRIGTWQREQLRVLGTFARTEGLFLLGADRALEAAAAEPADAEDAALATQEPA